MSISSRSCSAKSNTRTGKICIFCLASLFFPEQNTSFSKGQNRNREAKCSHCHLSGCNSITVLIYFCTSNGNSWCFSTSPQVHVFFLCHQWYFFLNCFGSYFLQHTACLCNAVIALLKVPLSFQRYFFQKLQSTSIKVSTAQVWPEISL